MRSALTCVLVVVLAVACARPNATVQVPPPTPSPSPTPTAPVALTATAPFHGDEVGVAYTPVTLSATGGVQPYTWSISAGALPNGLTLGPDGTVSGNPTTAGNFGFTVQVADSGDSTATMPGSIPIAAALSASLIPACTTQCSVELGCVNACGGFGQMSGGVGPYSFALTSGQLPSGTALSGLSLTGTFTGLSGYLRFSVQVTDSLGATATVSPLFWMYQHISLVGGTCYSTYYPFPCRASLPWSGGIPGGAPTVTVLSATGSFCTRSVTGAWVCNPSSNPPPNFSATVAGGSVTVSVPASPNYPFEYDGTVTLGLANQDPCGSGSYCSTSAAVKVTFAGG